MVDRLVEFRASQGYLELGEDALAWAENEAFDGWIERHGFEPYGWSDGFEGGYTVKIHRAKDRDARWHALVVVSDSDHWDYIVVSRPVDLIELRIKLMPWAALGAISRFDDMVSLAERAFSAWHGHDRYGFCEDCSPREWARHMEHLRKSRSDREPV